MNEKEIKHYNKFNLHTILFRFLYIEFFYITMHQQMSELKRTNMRYRL